MTFDLSKIPTVNCAFLNSCDDNCDWRNFYAGLFASVWADLMPCLSVVTWLVSYRFGTVNSNTVNSNTVNSKFHFIRSFCKMFSFHFPIISYLKCTVNSYLHLIQRKSLLMNDFELTVPDLYLGFPPYCIVSASSCIISLSSNFTWNLCLP